MSDINIGNAQAKIRDAIVSAVEGMVKVKYPSLPLAYDNSPFDWGSPPTEFVQVEIDFLDGDQVGMAYEPLTRFVGFIYVTAYARLGRGSRNLLLMLGAFSELLALKYIGPIQTQVAKPEGGKKVKDYYTEQVKFGFTSIPIPVR